MIWQAIEHFIFRPNSPSMLTSKQLQRFWFEQSAPSGWLLQMWGANVGATINMDISLSLSSIVTFLGLLINIGC